MMQDMSADASRCAQLAKSLSAGTALELVRTAVRRKGMTPEQIRAEVASNLKAAADRGREYMPGGALSGPFTALGSSAGGLTPWWHK